MRKISLHPLSLHQAQFYIPLVYGIFQKKKALPHSGKNALTPQSFVYLSLKLILQDSVKYWSKKTFRSCVKTVMYRQVFNLTRLDFFSPHSFKKCCITISLPPFYCSWWISILYCLMIVYCFYLIHYKPKWGRCVKAPRNGGDKSNQSIKTTLTTDAIPIKTLSNRFLKQSPWVPKSHPNEVIVRTWQ